MKTWRVKLKSGGHVCVGADYIKIEAGALIFRNTKATCNLGYQHQTYPEIVRAFAHGAWREVVPVEEARHVNR